MGGFWYYAGSEQPIGPLTFAELTNALLMLPEPHATLVWHTSFERWRMAGDVSEIASQIPKFSSYQSARRGTGGRPPGASTADLPKQSGGSRWRSFGLIAVMAIAFGVARQLFIYPNGVTKADPEAPISGKAREAFVKGGMDACLKKQENDPENKAASLSRESLSSYCSCYMENLATSITNGDLRDKQPQELLASATMKKKMESSSSACQLEFQKKLMGG